jgi:glutathione peroxidase
MKIWIVAAAVIAMVLAAGGIAYAKFVVRPTPPLVGAAGRSFYDFALTSIDGKPLPLSDYRGKVVLLVNTASKCGFTPQYDGLQALQDHYAERGFTVIGVPSGDFMGQELATNKDISAFCETRFGITFPMSEKAVVVGANALPVYRWAAGVLGSEQTPRWNFHKYLIGRDGKLVRAFGARVAPQDRAVTEAIEQALAG